MRRLLVLIVCLLPIGPWLLSASTQTQPKSDKLPSPIDFPAAAAGCKQKHKLIAKVTGDRLGTSTKLVECKLLIHRTCTSDFMEYSSGPRAVRANVCGDFYAAARALNGREICCDEKLPGTQQSSQNQDCPQPTPWFDTEDCNDPQTPEVQISEDTATLMICGNAVFSNKDANLKETLFATAYKAAMRDYLQARGAGKVCCDKFNDAAKSGSRCDPRADVDCDGNPNNTDIYDGRFASIDAFQTRAGAQIDKFPDRFNASDPDFRPERTARNSKGIGDCPCQWELTGGELKCSPDGKQQHYYKATWRCPRTGAEVFTVKYEPATTPCSK